MKIKEITCLTFNELSEEQQKKVIENNRLFNVDFDFWYESIIENWIEKLENLGFYDSEISFSGFYSQGDGASFTCKQIDINKILSNFGLSDHIRPLVLKLIEGDIIDYNFDLNRNYSRYYHEKSTLLSFYFNLYGAGNNLNSYLNNLSNKLETILSTEIIGLNREIYKDLENDYKYLTSDEAIKESLICNDYYFNSETLEIEY